LNVNVINIIAAITVTVVIVIVYVNKIQVIICIIMNNVIIYDVVSGFYGNIKEFN